MRVFVSHSSHDKPAVEALARGLTERGFEVWLDAWEIRPGDDIVAAINKGLDEADAGLIVFSDSSKDSRWVEAETSYLTWARIEEGKVLIPVKVEDDAWTPPLLRPLAYRGITEIEAIADGLRTRSAGRPADAVPAGSGRVEKVRVQLVRHEGEPGTAGEIEVRVHIGDEEHASRRLPQLPVPLVSARERFLRGFRTGVRRSPAAAERASLESSVAELGREMAAFCLPGGSAAALTELVGSSKLGHTVEVCFEAEDPELLGLPFEALRLPDGRLLAVQPAVTCLRRLAGLTPGPFQPLAGPLKVLVAVAAPDEELTTSVVLDHERELQNILDATEEAQRRDNVQVRILEVGHPEAMAQALERDAYHVLHISGHGLPGKLELEDEEGRAVLTTAAQLLEPLKNAGNPLPLVFLNTCHGGVQAEQTASFAEDLLRGGVPAVVAMQTSVSDHYATLLARGFYEHLARGEKLLPSRALAAARRELETARRKAVQHGEASLAETQPEYATATLFTAGDEAPLADFGLEKESLAARPVHDMSGPVPQLRLDDLIGRRKVLRVTLRTLRDDTRRHVGVVLTGIGGVGKSAVAGRAMRRLAEDGYLVAAHVGPWDLQGVAVAVGTALVGSAGEGRPEIGGILSREDLDDRVRLQLLAKVLAEQPVVLVLDDFEKSLTVDGSEYLDATTADQLTLLLQSARQGRLLVTCRHPVPGTDTHLHHIPVGPLSQAESRKLLRRLDRLAHLDPDDLGTVLRTIGGHPRMLEFLDGLLRGGEGRLPHVTEKLREMLDQAGVSAGDATEDLDEGLRQVVLLGARDVLLEELLEVCREEEINEALLQLAVSNLPVRPEGLAHMLGDGPGGDVEAAERALQRLERFSLVFRFPDGAGWVHRWTAEGLAALTAEDRHRERANRAGRYRMWRVENQSHSLEDAWEAVRNHLAGCDFDAATGVAFACFDALERFNQSLGRVALAAEVLAVLPIEHGAYAPIADQEGQALLALGYTSEAVGRYEALLRVHKERASNDPDRADYQRDLAVSYERMGDLYRALGQGEKAREAYLKDLEITERLASSEPDRADYQHGLMASYQRMGDLHVALGQGEKAREAYQSLLSIAERLASSEPDRADYQHDLMASYQRMGDLHVALGQSDKAQEAYQSLLSIAERLASSEPDRADYQLDLSVSYECMGGLYNALGQGEKAREAYQSSHSILERLASSEPDRADYQRDLSVSYDRMGGLYNALGQGEKAREAYQSSHSILERLASSEPDRADYQRDLSVSYDRMGELYRALGQGEKAREAYQSSLSLAERLASSEPDRADYQRDLSVSYDRMGDLYRALGQGEKAREAYQSSLSIAERLASSEPDRADYQRDLSVSYNKMGDLYVSLGQGEKARESYQSSLSIRERLASSEPDRADYQRDLMASYQRMGHVHMGLGDREKARDSYKSCLSIAERLTASEPDRSDHQTNLVRALLSGAPLTENRKELLQRALTILKTLDSQDRLEPVDRPMLQEVEELLAESHRDHRGDPDWAPEA